jgi:Rieske Fe-S protein
MITVNNFFRKRLLLLLFLIACEPDLVDDPMPFQPFPDISIVLNNYPLLITDGGYILISDGGVRGIILYHKNAQTYLAFERNCSYKPNDACATIEVHSSTLFMHDVCCGSSFDFEGKPTGGPAWRPLQQYRTSVSGTGTLTITDEIVN